MATGTPTRLTSDFLLTDLLATYYTVPGSTKVIAPYIPLTNNHSADVTVDIHRVPSGNSADTENLRFKGSSPNGLYLKPGESIDVSFGKDVLEAGDLIRMKASVTGVIGCSGISGLVVT